MTLSIAILGTALLFGGMTLYSFGFAAFLFSALPAQTAGTALRRAFPWFYAFVVVTATLSALFWWPHDMLAAALLAGVAVTTLPVWRFLMPAINDATDLGRRTRFKWLHGLSVLATLAHILVTGWLMARLA